MAKEKSFLISWLLEFFIKVVNLCTLHFIEKRFEIMDLLPTEIIWSILLMIISTFIFFTWYFGKKSERSYKISDAEAEEIRKRRLERLNSETVKDKEIETKKEFFRLNQPTALAEHPGIAKHDELTGVVDVETKETRSHCSQYLAVKSNIAVSLVNQTMTMTSKNKDSRITPSKNIITSSAASQLPPPLPLPVDELPAMDALNSILVSEPNFTKAVGIAGSWWNSACALNQIETWYIHYLKLHALNIVLLNLYYVYDISIIKYHISTYVNILHILACIEY